MAEEDDLQNFIEFCDSEFGKKVMKAEAGFIREKLGNNPGKILDVGCGIGVFEQLLTDLNITGLDSSEVFLAEAKQRSNKKFAPGDAEDLPFEDHEFGAVFSVATIEFLENYQKALKEMYRVLKPGGLVVILILNPHSEYFRMHMQKKDSYFKKMKHKSLRQIKGWFTALFQIEKGEYFLGIENGSKITNSKDERYAALYALVGRKEMM